MPVEIKELHIRVTVNQPQQTQPSGAPEGDKAEDEKDSIIAQCVDQVVSIINNKKER